MTKNVFVLVPTYNEFYVIRKIILELLVTGHEIVVVNDGSKDNTKIVICDLPIHYLTHPINLGQGAAIQTGTEFALKMGAQYMVHFDADGQHQPEDIANMLDILKNKEADIVLGSRFLRKQDYLAVPFIKRIILRGAIIANGLMTNLWLSDAHNGFRALNRKAAEKILLKQNGFAHATEILSEIKINNLKYLEIPVHIIYSKYSIDKGQSIWNSFNILIELIKRIIFP